MVVERSGCDSNAMIVMGVLFCVCVVSRCERRDPRVCVATGRERTRGETTTTTTTFRPNVAGRVLCLTF